MKLRLAGLQPESTVDGPGVRMTIFFQGCPHRCPGCHNPETHDLRGGYSADLAELVSLVQGAGPLDGVTFSGGEPFAQARAAARLAEAVLKRGFDLVLFSGYTFEELLAGACRDRAVRSLLEAGRLLIDGPFFLAERDLTLPYRGSRNQRLVDLPLSLASGKAVPWLDSSPGSLSCPGAPAASRAR